MQRKQIPVVGLILVAIMASISLSSWQVTKDNSPTVSYKMSSAVRPDSGAIANLGEEEASIIFSQNKATLYLLNPGKAANDVDLRIGGILVKDRLGTITEKNLTPLLFLLSDRDFFVEFNAENNSQVSTPYAPSFALRFKDRKGQVDLLFSLTSSQMSVVFNGEVKKTLNYSQYRQLIRYFRNITGNENYEKLLDSEEKKK